jgi:hypothetical protein
LAISLATRPTETLTLKFSDVDWHVTEIFYARLHPDHLKRAAGAIDSVLGNLVTNLVTNSPDHVTDAGAPRAHKLLIRFTLLS